VKTSCLQSEDHDDIIQHNQSSQHSKNVDNNNVYPEYKKLNRPSISHCKARRKEIMIKFVIVLDYSINKSV
jgi:hypothetical protein